MTTEGQPTAATPPAATQETAKPKSKALALRDELTAFGVQIKLVLPPHVGVEKFVRTTITAVMANPALIDATRKSLFKSCLDLAQRGLMPDGIESAIVPYRSKSGTLLAGAQPMVGGLLKLVKQGGAVRDIGADVVYSCDVFERGADSERGRFMKWVPCDDEAQRKEMRGVLAVASFKEGGTAYEFMTAAEIEKFRKLSKAQSAESPWSTWPERMALVRVTKRLCKRLPLSSDLLDFIRRTDEVEAAIHGTGGSPGAAAALNAMFTDSAHADGGGGTDGDQGGDGGTE